MTTEIQVIRAHLLLASMHRVLRVKLERIIIWADFPFLAEGETENYTLIRTDPNSTPCCGIAGSLFGRDVLEGARSNETV